MVYDLNGISMDLWNQEHPSSNPQMANHWTSFRPRPPLAGADRSETPAGKAVAQSTRRTITGGENAYSNKNPETRRSLGLLWSAVASFGAEPKPVTVSWPTLQTLNFNVPQSQQKAPVLALSGKRVSIPGLYGSAGR